MLKESVPVPARVMADDDGAADTTGGIRIING